MPRSTLTRYDGTERTSRRRLLCNASIAVGVGLTGCISRSLPADSSTYDRPQEEFHSEPLPYDETFPDDDEITMFRGGLRRLGYYPHETVPESVTVNWQLPVNYIGHTATKASPLPTPSGETVLIPADTGRVHAVTPQGEHRWIAETEATVQGIHASPLVADGIAYIGDYGGANRGSDASVHAFDIETGNQLWQNTNLNHAVAIGSSPGYWDGVLYVVAEYRRTLSGALWALDAETGETLWGDDRIDGMPHPTVAIDPSSERLLTGSNDGKIYCWKFPSLEFAWHFQTGGEIKGPIATYDGSAFFGSWDHHFYRVNLEDGTEEWSFETDDIVMSAPGIDPETNVVYFGSDDWHLYALDAETGEQLWATDIKGKIMGAVTVTADAVLAGTNAAELCALEKDTGELRWWVINNGHVTSEPVPRDGRIYYAERGIISGYEEEGEQETTEVPGHAYCLVSAD
jgi:outer membrane protein assembly factor BamB